MKINIQISEDLTNGKDCREPMSQDNEVFSADRSHKWKTWRQTTVLRTGFQVRRDEGRDTREYEPLILQSDGTLRIVR